METATTIHERLTSKSFCSKLRVAIFYLAKIKNVMDKKIQLARENFVETLHKLHDVKMQDSINYQG